MFKHSGTLDTWKMGGPIWSEPIHDKTFVSKLLEIVDAEGETFASHERLLGLLTTVNEVHTTNVFTLMRCLCHVTSCPFVFVSQEVSPHQHLVLKLTLLLFAFCVCVCDRNLIALLSITRLIRSRVSFTASVHLRSHSGECGVFSPFISFSFFMSILTPVSMVYSFLPCLNFTLSTVSELNSSGRPF